PAGEVGGGEPGHAQVAAGEHPAREGTVQSLRGLPDRVSFGHGSRVARRGWSRSWSGARLVRGRGGRGLGPVGARVRPYSGCGQARGSSGLRSGARPGPGPGPGPGKGRSPVPVLVVVRGAARSRSWSWSGARPGPGPGPGRGQGRGPVPVVVRGVAAGRAGWPRPGPGRGEG